jgi:hypothetical protein
LKGFSGISIDDIVALIDSYSIHFDILPLHHFHTLEAAYALWDRL